MQGLTFHQPDSALKRVPFLRRCRLRATGLDGLGIVCNLSVQGAFVAADRTPRVGDVLRLSFQLPTSSEYLTIDAVVCWENSDNQVPGLPRGCGVKFLAPAKADRDRIERIVRAFTGR